jgi:hypothetical protein
MKNEKNKIQKQDKKKKQEEKEFNKYLKSIEFKPLGHLRESLSEEDCLSYL